MDAGQGDPSSDSRCAVILKGASTDATVSNCNFKSLGAYVWEDADATFQNCTFDGGLHGLYAWGKCKVEVAGCNITGTEKSGVCIREGCTLAMRVCSRYLRTSAPGRCCATVTTSGWHCDAK